VKPINFYEKQNLFASLADSQASSSKEIMIVVPKTEHLKLAPPQTKKLVVYSSQGKTRKSPEGPGTRLQTPLSPYSTRAQ
jgi:hypothetical protein